MFLRFTSKQTYRIFFFLYILFAIHHSLKCHWDQDFGIPYFCIFENSLRLLVTMPNFNSLQRLEVAFFGRFLSRFYGRHYWPLFRQPACELVEVTSEAHLKISTFHTVTCHGKFNSRRGKFSCQLFAVRPWIFRCCSSYKGYYLCCTMLQQYKVQPPSWYFASSKPCERTRNGNWMDNVRTHTQCKFQPERYFCRLFWSPRTSVSRGLFMSKDPRGRLFHCPFQLHGEKRSGKNETKGT